MANELYTFNDKVVDVLEQYSNKLSMRVIWTNARPTSSFVTQDITLNVSGLAGIYITSIYDEDRHSGPSLLCMFDARFNPNSANIRGGTQLLVATTHLIYRGVLINDYTEEDGVTVHFESGYIQTSYGSTSGQVLDNTRNIPQTIYGIFMD